MNKTVAALIDATKSVFQPQPADVNTTLEQYVARPGQPYLSGAHTVTAQLGPFGVPYWMQGLPVQTCNNEYITAPVPQEKSAITHQAQLLYAAGQYGIGSAPTNGIFTGVEDHCS